MSNSRDFSEGEISREYVAIVIGGVLVSSAIVGYGEGSVGAFVQALMAWGVVLFLATVVLGRFYSVAR